MVHGACVLCHLECAQWGGSLLEQALKTGWRNPRETGAQRLQRILVRGRTKREELGDGGLDGL